MMDLRKALGLESEQVEENTVSYEMFLTSENGAIEGPDEKDVHGLRLQLLEHVLPIVEGYIWQRARFDLHVASLRPAPWHGTSKKHAAGREETTRELEAQLWGSVGFGDNVEDEWFVVWLLLLLTKAFPVAARVWDNDGDFMLIEAAYSLPKWLKPETATNRVWLHGGTLHIVALPRVAGDPLIPAHPTRLQALQLVCGAMLDTRAPPKAAAPILQRLEGLPGKAQALMQSTRVVVPARVAHLLRREPQLLAPAVEAFHYRDVDDMRAAARMALFPPHAMVPLRATFTRCLYAQLALQELHPVRGYPMPLPSDPQFKAAEMGMKLTAGFEMMAANPERFGQHPASSGADDPPDEISQGEALEGDPSWEGFCSRLQKDGYFGGHSAGAPQHSTLLQHAVQRYRRVQAYRRRTAALAAPAARVRQLLQEAIEPAETYPPFQDLPPDDSEGWLHEGSSELEGELQRRQEELAQHEERKIARKAGGAGAAPQGSSAPAGFDPDALASRLRQFVEMTAGLEGAELPGGQRGKGGRAGAGMELDEARFAAELERALGLEAGAFGAMVADEDGESSSESSEEGSSFYSGSGSDGESGDESDDESPRAAANSRATAHRAATAAAAAAAGISQPRATGGAAAPSLAAAAGGGVAGGRGQRAGAGEELWEVATATDSDDEGEGSGGAESEGGGEGEGEGDLGDFMDAYSRAMQAQLASTTLGRSFASRAGEVGGDEPTGAGGAAGGSGAPPPPPPQQQRQQQQRPGEGLEGEEAGELQPVDVDFNLVEGLLASYHSQAGLAGPAGSLAAMLGISLPPPPPPPSQQPPPNDRDE